MSGNAAVLIDLENFYLGREANYSEQNPEDIYEFQSDLEDLYQITEALAEPHNLIVKRAYANFNDRRPGTGEKRWDFYLQPQSRLLMESGIEPVQVFRFPGGGNKNAADMRLAMDALTLREQSAEIQKFILVTGDSDFIPLVIELRSRGAEVIVIGVMGSTKSIFERYSDRFEYFEELLAASRFERKDGDDIASVRHALQGILAKRSPISFAAVKPLITNRLKRRFDPNRFRCESTGDFLRKYEQDLGIVVNHEDDNGWEVSLSHYHQAETLPPSVAITTNMREPLPGVRHTTGLYRNLLRYGSPRIYMIHYREWDKITEVVYRISTGGEDGERPRTFHEELLSRVTEACADEGMEDAGRKVNDTLFQLFKSGCFVCADEGSEPNQTDFHWSRPAILDPALTDVHLMRHRIRQFVVQILRRRLEQRGHSGEIEPRVLAELLFGPELADDADILNTVQEIF